MYLSWQKIVKQEKKKRKEKKKGEYVYPHDTEFSY